MKIVIFAFITLSTASLAHATFLNLNQRSLQIQSGSPSITIGVDNYRTLFAFPCLEIISNDPNENVDFQGLALEITLQVKGGADHEVEPSIERQPVNIPGQAEAYGLIYYTPPTDPASGTTFELQSKDKIVPLTNLVQKYSSQGIQIRLTNSSSNYNCHQ